VLTGLDAAIARNADELAALFDPDAADGTHSSWVGIGIAVAESAAALHEVSPGLLAAPAGCVHLLLPGCPDEAVWAVGEALTAIVLKPLPDAPWPFGSDLVARYAAMDAIARTPLASTLGQMVMQSDGVAGIEVADLGALAQDTLSTVRSRGSAGSSENVLARAFAQSSSARAAMSAALSQDTGRADVLVGFLWGVDEGFEDALVERSLALDSASRLKVSLRLLRSAVGNGDVAPALQRFLENLSLDVVTYGQFRRVLDVLQAEPALSGVKDSAIVSKVLPLLADNSDRTRQVDTVRILLRCRIPKAMKQAVRQALSGLSIGRMGPLQRADVEMLRVRVAP
jgi:hypothetical protein